MAQPHPLLPRLRQARVVPVVRIATAAQAANAVQWLRDAGLKISEITMTVPDATGGIEPAEVKAYLSAGAAFVGIGGALIGGDQGAVQRAARRVLEQAG